nr:MerR family transcriptional regulator [Nocardia transvalensis]
MVGVTERRGTDEGGITVGAAAERAGVTVRALHHWDTIGLVRPSARTGTGYRLYTAADLARVHRVLVYRELGIPLGEIGELLDAPGDATTSLIRQRDLVRGRIERLRRMDAALDRMIEARASGILLSDEEQVAIFGSHWRPSWTGEARERWGDTVQWAQYAERSAGRTAEHWQRIADGIDALHADLAAAHRDRMIPGSPEADALAELHRASMGQFFDCTHSMHACLGRTYATDPGFAGFYDGLEPGLAAWLRDIIAANARAHGVDPETATWT